MVSLSILIPQEDWPGKDLPKVTLQARESLRPLISAAFQEAPA